MKQQRSLLRCFGGQGRARVLYCPHAGGGASVARYLRDELPEQIELWTVQLPGREDRFSEAPFASLVEVATAIGNALKILPILPTVLFGHSMGAIVAYETSHVLIDSTWLKALMVCGHRPPQQLGQGGSRHKLDDVVLLQELWQLGGMSVEALNNSMLMELVLPVLRQDFFLLENWSNQPRSALNVPIIAMAGKNDPEVDVLMLSQWGALSRKGGYTHIDNGGHFYLFTQTKLIAARILAALK